MHPPLCLLASPAPHIFHSESHLKHISNNPSQNSHLLANCAEDPRAPHCAFLPRRVRCCQGPRLPNNPRVMGALSIHQDGPWGLSCSAGCGGAGIWDWDVSIPHSLAGEDGHRGRSGALLSPHSAGGWMSRWMLQSSLDSVLPANSFLGRKVGRKAAGSCSGVGTLGGVRWVPPCQTGDF